MNTRRVAALHRELAEIHAKLAAELDEESPAVELVESPAPPRPRAVRKTRAIVRPAGENTPRGAELADRILRARGLR